MRLVGRREGAKQVARVFEDNIGSCLVLLTLLKDQAPLFWTLVVGFLSILDVLFIGGRHFGFWHLDPDPLPTRVCDLVNPRPLPCGCWVSFQVS